MAKICKTVAGWNKAKRSVVQAIRRETIKGCVKNKKRWQKKAIQMGVMKPRKARMEKGSAEAKAWGARMRAARMAKRGGPQPPPIPPYDPQADMQAEWMSQNPDLAARIRNN